MEGEGYMFYFPLYNNLLLRSLYLAGSFYWVFLLDFIGEFLCNSDEAAKSILYKVVVDPSMWAYLSHYLWVVIICVYIVKPSEMGLFSSLLVLLLLTHLFILASYVILTFSIRKINQLIKSRNKQPDGFEK
jgi:hypothetical protein